MDLFQIIFTAMLVVNLAFLFFCVALKVAVEVRLGGKERLTAKEVAMLEGSESKSSELYSLFVKIVVNYGSVYAAYHFGGWWAVISLSVFGILLRSFLEGQKGGKTERVV